MDLPSVIDVAIGLVVLFLLLSTVCSFALEIVAGWRWWRKKLLYKMVGRLVTGEGTYPAPSAPVLPNFLRKSKTINESAAQDVAMGALDQAVGEFWEHPLARNLSPEREIPSYLESSTFAAIVIDIAVPGAAAGTLPSTAEGIERVIELGANSGEAYLKPLREQLLTIFRLREISRTAGQPEPEPLVELRSCIEKWYNEAMDRLSGQYKRKAQRALFVLGLLCALIFNADTVRTAYILSTDDSMRSTIAAYAVTLAANTNSLALPNDPGFTALVRSNEMQVAELRTNLVGSLKELQKLQQLGFPLGWKGGVALNFVPYDNLVRASAEPKSGGRWWWVVLIPAKIAGLLATAFAVSLGAPFWFDLLNKLINLRGSGKRVTAPAPSKAGGETVSSTGGAAPPTSSPATAAASPTTPVGLDFGKDLSDARVGFDARKAYWLSEASLLAYSAKQSVTSAVQQWSLDMTHFFEDVQACQGFLAVAKDKKIAVLAFRGTEKKLEDWKTDSEFKLAPSPTGAGETHEGFTTQLAKVYAEITDKLKADLQPDTLLYVTGHSLGAALATLMAARLAKDRICGVHSVHTFGSPRVGNPEFARAYQLALGHCTFRVVNAEDLVTRVPPRVVPTTKWEYDHVGQVVYFDTDGRMHLNAGFWERFLNTVINAVQDFRTTAKAALKDHSMDGYIRLVKQQINHK